MATQPFSEFDLDIRLSPSDQPEYDFADPKLTSNPKACKPETSHTCKQTCEGATCGQACPNTSAPTCAQTCANTCAGGMGGGYTCDTPCQSVGGAATCAQTCACQHTQGCGGFTQGASCDCAGGGGDDTAVATCSTCDVGCFPGTKIN